MKKIFGLMSGLAISALSMAQTADDVINKMIEALGGKEKIAAIQTVEMQGAVEVMGTSVDLKMTQAHNKGSRQDISVAGMTGYVITTTDKGWSYIPFQGQTKPEPMTEEDIKAGLDDLDVQGSYVDYQAKGHTVELKGTEDIEGTECFKLVINRKNSGMQTLFVDKDSYLVIRSVSKRTAMGQEMDVVADMSDYKAVNGVMMPHAVSQPGLGTVKISSIKVNGELPADIFTVK